MRPLSRMLFTAALVAVLCPAAWAVTAKEWDSKGDDFKKGKMDGVSTNSAGELVPAPPYEKTVTDEVAIWCSVTSSQGVTYFGTGQSGTIYKLEGDQLVPVLPNTGFIAKLEDETEAGETPTEEKADLGMTVDEITPALARQLGLSEETGLVVVEVEANSPAEEAGIARGDIIRAIDHEPVNDVETYKKKIRGYKEGDVILLYVKKRNGPTLYLTLKVRE